MQQWPDLNMSSKFEEGEAHLDSSVGTMTIKHPDPVSLSQVESFLQDILWEKEGGCCPDTEILRLKGLVSLGDR